MDQCRGHVDELRAQFDIHLRGALHIFEILRCDLRDRDVIDLDFLFPDQIQQQIERAIVMFQVKIKRS